MNNKFCHNCGAQNKAENAFCHNCGARQLSAQNNINGVYGQVAPQYYTNTPVYGGYVVIPQQPIYVQPQIVEIPQQEVNIDGITEIELYAYIGSQSLTNKIASMQQLNSKISWCWPVSVLSFFLGFFGAAFWFLYRRMYKLAIIFMILGLIFQTVSTVVATYYYEPQVTVQTVDGTNEEFKETYSSDVEEASTASTNSYQQLWTAVEFLIMIGLTVFSGLFAINVYKNHCVKKIKKFKEVHFDSKYYYQGLAVMGGAADSLVVFAVIGYIFIANIINVICHAIFIA